MSTAQIHAYLNGWAEVQKRIHGSDDSDASNEDIPDMSDEDQTLLANYMMRNPKQNG